MASTSKFKSAVMTAIICAATGSVADAAMVTTGPSFHRGMTAPRLPEPHFRAEGPRLKKFWEKVEGDCVAVAKPPKHRDAAVGYLGPATGGRHDFRPKGGYQAPPTDGSGKSHGGGQLVTECK